MGLYHKGHVDSLVFNDEVNEGWIWNSGQWLRVFKAAPVARPAYFALNTVEGYVLDRSYSQEDWHRVGFSEINNIDEEEWGGIPSSVTLNDSIAFPGGTWNKIRKGSLSFFKSSFLISVQPHEAISFSVRLKRGSQIVWEDHFIDTDDVLHLGGDVLLGESVYQDDNWSVEVRTFEESEYSRVAFVALMIAPENDIFEMLGLPEPEPTGPSPFSFYVENVPMYQALLNDGAHGIVSDRIIDAPFGDAYASGDSVYSGESWELAREGRSEFYPAKVTYEISVEPTASVQEFYIYRESNLLVSTPISVPSNESGVSGTIRNVVFSGNIDRWEIRAKMMSPIAAQRLIKKFKVTIEPEEQ